MKIQTGGMWVLVGEVGTSCARATDCGSNNQGEIGLCSFIYTFFITYNINFSSKIYIKRMYLQKHMLQKKYKHILYCYSILALHMQSNHAVVILCLQFNFPPLKCNWVTLNHVHICTNVYNIHVLSRVLAISCINAQACE